MGCPAPFPQKHTYARTLVRTQTNTEGKNKSIYRETNKGPISYPVVKRWLLKPAFKPVNSR